MKRGLLHTRMPTIFAFLILFSSLWVVLFSLRDRVITTGRAGPDTIPQNITISNQTDTSFSVSFITVLPTEGALSFTGPDGSTSLVLDDRDKAEGDALEYSSHLITINRLSPSIEYSFSILVNGKEYINDGSLFKVTTGPAIQNPPNQNPVFGKVIRLDGGPASDTLVTLQTKDSQILSTLTNQEGEYIIPTNTLRLGPLDQYFHLAAQNELTIHVYWQNLVSQAKIIYQNSNSIPTITLSNEYEFTQTYQITQNIPPEGLSLPEGFSPSESGEFTMTVPVQDQSFVDPQPQFRGSAPPNSQFTLNLDNNTFDVTSNTTGGWTFRPSVRLPQGEHTITIEGNTTEGKFARLVRRFSVFPQGSQVIESATPSATPKLTNTPSPTQRPSITLTQAPTLTPTASLTTTPNPTVEPTATPAPTNLPTPTTTVAPTITTSLTPTTPETSSTQPPPPPQKIPAGSNLTLLGLIASGFIIAAGTLLFLLL